MQGEKIIGKHNKCGGEVESWWQDGHYYYYSGVHCLKCKKTFKSSYDEEIRSLDAQLDPPDPPVDDSYVKLAEGSIGYEH